MIYERVKKLASERQLDIKGVERKAGLTNGTIGKWRNSTPSAESIIKVANALNTTTDYLLLGGKATQLDDEFESFMIDVYRSQSPLRKAEILNLISKYAEKETKEE